MFSRHFLTFSLDPEISAPEHKMFDVVELLGDEIESNWKVDELFSSAIQIPEKTSNFSSSLVDSEEISTSEYLQRRKLYDRPVAFEKTTENLTSFDRHRQFVEHLNETNDFTSYLEYLNENRHDLFYTLTDSVDLIDVLLGSTFSFSK